MEYAELRQRMVEEQLKARGVKDERVLAAFAKVERHLFLPAALREGAYADFPLPIGEGQTISQPYMAALMTESMKLSGKERVLEIGTGSGYQAAILGELSGEVYTIERFESLSRKAGELLGQLGYKNITLRSGDGTLGWPEAAPFDRIIITAACPRVPLSLLGQLTEAGALLLPLGEVSSQVLTLIEKKQGQVLTTSICGCVFVPLVGKFGYPE